MRNQRLHRFPPLSELLARSGVGRGAPASAPSAVAEGFQQGMDKGYEQGLQAGLQSGHEQGHAAGHEEGLRQGLDLGRREALAHFESLARPLDAALQALNQLQTDYQAALRQEVVELVGKVARQVIRCELALQPPQLLNMVDETLATLPRVPDSTVEVFLNPEELQRIRELDPERARRWTLIADPRLEPGECHVKAGQHEADAGCRQRQAAVMEQVSGQLLAPSPGGQP